MNAAPPLPEPLVELPEPEPATESGPPEPAPLPRSRKSTRGKRDGLPASLARADRVAVTVKKLGADAPIAKIASEAGVSVSTARRYMPADSASDSQKVAFSVDASASPVGF
jgi:hypothetical protein